MTIVGTISKLYFYLLAADKELLILSISSIVSVLLVALLYFLKMKPESKPAFKEQIQPLLFRAVIGLIVSVTILFVSHLRVYENFGPHRDDAKYVILLMEKMDNPDDEEAQKHFEEYHELKRTPPDDDDKTSTGND